MRRIWAETNNLRFNTELSNNNICTNLNGTQNELIVFLVDLFAADLELLSRLKKFDQSNFDKFNEIRNSFGRGY